MSAASKYLLHNGTCYEAQSAPQLQLNRAFTLGDGFFETLRIVGGRIHQWPAHYARIVSACKALSLELPAGYTQRNLHDLLTQLLTNEGLSGGGRLRLTFFREGGGAYRPETNRAGFLAQATAYYPSALLPADKGIAVGVYRQGYKAYAPTSAYKLLGNHIYIAAARWAAEQGLDDALILNQRGSIIESASSTIFLVKGDELFTPPISSGCVAGVMRMCVINAALSSGLKVYEMELMETDVREAQEVFLSNALRVSWVGSFQSKRYFHKVSDSLLTLINKQAQQLPQLSEGSRGA